MTTHTRAAVWRGAGHIAVESIPMPLLAAGEVLVRVRLATVCGSDRHTVSGRRSQPCPSILGHETVGEVIEIGAGGARAVDGRPLRIGHRVIWSVTLPCGGCDRCRAGLTAKCRSVRKTGHEALDSGWTLSGGYAQHVLLPKGLAIAIVDDELPDTVAAPAACATATVMAVIERAGPLSGRRVTVIGAGMLGLGAIAAAARDGAHTVRVVDPAASRRQLARRFGATEASPTADAPVGCDVLLEFSGSSAALQAALVSLDVQGVAVLAGTVTPGPPILVDPEMVVRRHLSISGVHNYEPRHLSAALDFLQQTRDHFPWSELVAEPKGLDDIAALLTQAGGTRPRCAVAP